VEHDDGFCKVDVIDGMHLGKSLHLALHAAPPSQLMTRGVHWINEVPFNRRRRYTRRNTCDRSRGFGNSLEVEATTG
jgi:hypothetical protein